MLGEDSAVASQLPSRGEGLVRVADVGRLLCHVEWTGLSDWCSLSETQLVQVRSHLPALTENCKKILLT